MQVYFQSLCESWKNAAAWSSKKQCSQGVAAIAASLRLFLKDAGGPDSAGLMVALSDLSGFFPTLMIL